MKKICLGTLFKYHFLLLTLIPLIVGVIFYAFMRYVVNEDIIKYDPCIDLVLLEASQKYYPAANPPVPIPKCPFPDVQMGEAKNSFEVEPLSEVRGRYLWGSSFMIANIAGLAAIVFVILVISRCSDDDRRFVTIGVASVASLAAAVLFFSDPHFSNVLTRQLFERFLRTVPMEPELNESSYNLVKGLLPWAQTIVFATVAFVALGASSLAPRIADSRQSSAIASHLKNKKFALDRLMYVSSGALVVGVIAIRAELQWPMSALDEVRILGAALGVYSEPTIAIAHANHIVTALLAYWGSFLTVTLALIFFPVAYLLSAQLEDLQPPTGKDKATWLAELGIDSRFESRMGQVVGAVAPLLTGTAVSAMDLVFG